MYELINHLRPFRRRWEELGGGLGGGWNLESDCVSPDPGPHTVGVPAPGHGEGHGDVPRPWLRDTENKCLHSFSSCISITTYISGTV